MERIASSSSKIIKKFPLLLQDSRIRNFIILLSIAFLIWFGGPYIAIAGNSIFANVNHRLIAILILAILWALINLQSGNKKINISTVLEKKHLPTTISTPAINFTVKTEIKQLQSVFKNTIRSLKRSQAKRFWPSMELPTYLVLGVSHAGKTSLLTQAKADDSLPLFSEKYYDGWLIEDSIFFDYIENETLSNPETDQLLWHKFLQLIKKYKRQLSFRGIIVAVDLSQLLQQNSTINAEKVCQRLQTMAGLFSNLPVYLIFTHCDLIAGFTDFFEDLNQEERAQALGFTFPNIKTSRNFREIFDVQLNTLLKRLNERLIWRLHQEHNSQKRARIKDFPFQMEILKNAIANLVNQIGNITNVKLCGSYFTSCSQQQSSLNFLTPKLEKHFNLKQHPTTFPPKNIQNKTFFSERLLQQIINHSLENNQLLNTQSKRTYIIYASAALIIISLGSFWLENYADNLTTINTLQLAITSSKNINDHDPYAVLPYLNILSQALEKINTQHTRWLYLDLQQTDQIKIIATQTYQDLLATRFLPAITSLVTMELNSNNKTPADTYNALKAYLMLTDLKVRDPQFLKQWFTAYWQQQLTINITEQQQLNRQFNELLQQRAVLTPNWSLIITTRNNLNQIPAAQLIYSLLVNEYQQPVKLMAANDVLSVNNYSIPVFFTAANYSTIYHQQIPQFSQEIINAQWVLGKNNSLSAINLQQLISQLQLNYLNQYANAWAQLLTKINLNIPQNLIETAHIFKILGSSASPLWQLLNTINSNTNATVGDTQFASTISIKFLSLNNFIQSPAYDDLQKSFAKANDYFNKIYSSANPDKAAFNATAKRMENNGQRPDVLENLFQQIPVLPTPLQGWTNALAVNSWHLLLSNAQSYLNTVWNQTVLPPYHAMIDNKYPLYKDASIDANLEDFAIFFAPDGTIDNFFNYYLKPFVDTHNVYWVWKTIDNDHIAIPQTTLEMFIRAAIIKKMYFAEGGHQPFVKFTLTPLGMEPGVIDFNLNIEGQIINLQLNHTPQTSELSWPGPDPDKVTMQFINHQGKLATTTETGPWAWFRLLAKANLQTAWKNPRVFKITFDLNGNSVKYQLMASDLVNPFIAGIVDVFRCPEKL